MLASVMLLLGIFLFVAGLLGILKAAFQVSSSWGYFSLLGIPMVLFSFRYFYRVKFSLMVISLAIASIGVSLIGGADKSLQLRLAADSLGIGQYPVVNMLRYPDEAREEVIYANIEEDNKPWPVQVQLAPVESEVVSYISIAPKDMGNYLGRHVIARTFSGEVVKGFIDKMTGNRVVLRLEKLNSRSSFTYNSELFERVEVASR